MVSLENPFSQAAITCAEHRYVYKVKAHEVVVPAEPLFCRKTNMSLIQILDEFAALSLPVDDVICFAVANHQKGHVVATASHNLFVMIHPVVDAHVVVLC